MTDVGTFPAIAAIVIFCLAIVLTLFLVFKPVALRIPLRGRQPFIINVKYYIAPVAAVLAMLACTSMTIGDVGRGLLGNDQIKPYGILILFMSMAYIAGSLDASGIFAWLALKFTAMSGGRGRVLFLFYFLLSSFITTFTSNDVCILTLTPIVCYFAKATGVDPMPFLFAEYAAANTFGALLYTGNPTNIIVAQAYDMTFLGYSKYMTLPTLAGGVACFGMLLIEFHRDVPVSIPLPSVDASHMLRDKLGAWAGSVNMLACLALLAAAPSLGWEMWAITLVCAGIHCVYNIWAYRSSLLQVPLAECWTCGCQREDEDVAALAAADSEGTGDSSQTLSKEELAVPVMVGMVADSKANPAVLVKAQGGDKAVVRETAELGGNSEFSTDGDPAVLEVGQKAPSTDAKSDSGCSGSPSDSQAGRGASAAAAGATAPDGHSRFGGAAMCGSRHRLQAESPRATTGAPGPVAEGTEAAEALSGSGPGFGVVQPAPITSIALAAETAGGAATPVGMETNAEGKPGLAPTDAAAVAPEITVDMLRGKEPTFWALLFDLPWEVVPFALGMFVLVEGLYVQGWLNVFGSGLGKASETLPAAIFIMGFLSVALANTINNQPMTILLTRVALDPRYISYVGYGSTHKAALFALVLGSNIGAVFTIIGALAGILWSNILQLHGKSCSYVQFARVCCPVGFVTLVASLLVLWFEFAVFPNEG